MDISNYGSKIAYMVKTRKASDLKSYKIYELVNK